MAAFVDRSPSIHTPASNLATRPSRRASPAENTTEQTENDTQSVSKTETDDDSTLTEIESDMEFDQDIINSVESNLEVNQNITIGPTPTDAPLPAPTNAAAAGSGNAVTRYNKWTPTEIAALTCAKVMFCGDGTKGKWDDVAGVIDSFRQTGNPARTPAAASLKWPIVARDRGGAYDPVTVLRNLLDEGDPEVDPKNVYFFSQIVQPLIKLKS